MFNQNILNNIVRCINQNGNRNAFCIDEEHYTYAQFGECISKIRSQLIKINHSNTKVGLVINDDLETYASIIALWLEGECYVPLHPNWPLERCQDICEQVEIDLILDSSKETRYERMLVVKTTPLEYEQNCLIPKECISDDELAYILFTSGSTGKPKGVQLSRKNLAAFVDAFFDVYSIDENDRCLQCFDLSFDLSIMSYLIPLVKGACVYTVPPDVIKYSYIGGLIEDARLTVALMAPSTIKYLRPYFDEIDCTSLKYSLFCGEALPLDVTIEWSQCAQNAIIDNVYGPTEDTIFCSIYRFSRTGNNKTYNGILSIGKPMKKCGMTIFDENLNECEVGVLGNLCLSGDQLTMGYLKNKEKNEESFFLKENVRWYKTGDLCYIDEDGNIMYSGRLDHQAKIQGFRVELGEIEYHAKEFLGNKNVVCMAYEDLENLTRIAMFIESKEFNPDEMIAYMRNKMPSYMIPSKFYYLPIFPLNANDKTDKVKLKSMIQL